MNSKYTPLFESFNIGKGIGSEKSIGDGAYDKFLF